MDLMQAFTQKHLKAEPPVVEAVSYTHLDVYKRQAYQHLGLPMPGGAGGGGLDQLSF